MRAPRSAQRLRLRKHALSLVEAKLFTHSITALILLNAVILGLETFPSIMASLGPVLVAADQLILGVFVVELALRLFAHGGSFFRDPWSLFDTGVVAIALVPASEAFSVLRALRVFTGAALDLGVSAAASGDFGAADGDPRPWRDRGDPRHQSSTCSP